MFKLVYSSEDVAKLALSSQDDPVQGGLEYWSGLAWWRMVSSLQGEDLEILNAVHITQYCSGTISPCTDHKINNYKIRNGLKGKSFTPDKLVESTHGGININTFIISRWDIYF